MKSVKRIATALFTAAIFALIGCESSKKKDPPDLAFVGSETCGQADCHADQYGHFIESGHPYKLRKLTGTAPVFPMGTSPGVPNPPTGLTWADTATLDWIIGGYGWKARFVKADGYVYGTGGAGGGQGLNQYNLATSAYVDYNKTSETKYNYDCFKCHTTGAEPDSAWKPNMAGTFQSGGVQCEECHGQGSQHAFDPDGYEMTISTSADACGQCHERNWWTSSNPVIPASGGFVQHHEQYNELKTSPHASMTCVACHDPHKGVVYFRDNSNSWKNANCTDAGCHAGKTSNGFHASAACTTCHMAKTGKSAVSTNTYTGDISSHSFRILDAAATKTDSMFNTAGTSVILRNGQSSITLDFACYACHKDTAGVGGTGSIKTLSDLRQYDMHP